MIVSNPPYIADTDVHLRQGDLRFEPRMALASGADGLDAIRAIVSCVPAHLRLGGWLLFEHGYDQGTTACDVAARAGFICATQRDIESRDRVCVAQWPAGAAQ
jgi:release factor glutamine methyltransferase